MTFEECARCGKRIHEGDIRYIIRLTVVGDDGGEPDETQNPDTEIEKILGDMEDMEPYELENGVFEERVFILCSPCKRAALRNPFGLNSNHVFDDDEFAGPIQ